MTETVKHLMDVCEATWPPARSFPEGPFMLRDGAGGGKRVSAATLAADINTVTDQDLAAAEKTMGDLGQPPLFQIRANESAFDALLAAKGYKEIDPVKLYLINAKELNDIPIPRVTTFAIWEPLAIMKDIWIAGGTDPARFDVMERAACPKTGILGRIEDTPAATAYIGLHGKTAMLHALEVIPNKRRKGMANWIMRAAAKWTLEQGGTHLAVLCVKTNTGANELYTDLGFAHVGTYHYRIKYK